MTKALKISNKYTNILVVFFAMLFVALLLAIPHNLTQMSTQNSKKLSAFFHVDASFKLDLEQTIALSPSQWQPVERFNFGLQSEPYWLKLQIHPRDLAHQDGNPHSSSNTIVESSDVRLNITDKRLFLINYGLLDEVDLWLLSDTGDSLDILAAYKTGDTFIYSQRTVQFEQFLFPVPDVQESIWVYLRIQSKGPLKVPLELWDESDFIEFSGLHKIFMGIFFGFMLAMGLSNLFIFASSRNVLFVLYAGYVTSIAMVVSSLHAVAFHYLWPTNLWLQEFAIPIFASLTLIFIISLTIRLLELKESSPKIYRLLKVIRWIYVALLTLCFFSPYEIVIKSVLILLIISAPIILTSGIVLAVRGNQVARYFCAAWLVLLFSGINIAFENLGIYESPIDSTYLIMVGAIVESILLALALSLKFSNQLEMSKHVKLDALANEQAALSAKDELIALQEKNREDLEYSIEERTLELEIALRELAEKNQDLERLSAIDPLTGLMNRRYFDKRLLAEARRSRRELTPLSLAMLDIDHFKKVNDTYGHLGGDTCLKVFAEVLKEYVKRPSDVVCRYGGEEFVLILPNTDEQGLQKLLEKIRKAIEDKKILFEGNDIPITVSIGGCSRIIASDDEQALLLAFVDKQMYKAKQTGRNKVVIEGY